MNSRPLRLGVTQRESLYITQYIILRHSERLRLISTYPKVRNILVLFTGVSSYVGLIYGCDEYTYTDSVTETRWHQSVIPLCHLTHHTAFMAYHGHTIQQSDSWRAQGLHHTAPRMGLQTKDGHLQ
jgi:hypothetical protein